MSEPKLPARALHETGTPQRSEWLLGIYWTPAGGVNQAARNKLHVTITPVENDDGVTLVVDKSSNELWKSAPF